MSKRRIDEYFQVVGYEQPEQPQLKRIKRGKNDHEHGIGEARSCVAQASECDMLDLLSGKPTVPIATDNEKEKSAKNKCKLPGFSRSKLPRKWCNKPTYDLVREYLLKHGMELDEGESRKCAKWKTKTKIKVRCRKCKTTSDSTCLNSLQQGQGIACFCSGSMPMSSRQYYDTVMNNAELCNELGWYTAFHREVAPVEKPSFEVWEPAAAQGCEATLNPLTCSRCKTTSDSTSLSSLQSGKGIACFCPGSNMPLSSRQYYNTVMNNAELCNELGCYTAFHREVAPVEKPSFEVWKAAAAQGQHVTLKSLTCSRCKTTSDSTCLSSLQQGQGIACGCVNKTEGLVWFPQLRKQAIDDGHELLCDTAGQYKPDHLRAQTGKGDLSRRKFDGGLRILPIGRPTSEELDGRQHFEDVRKFKNSTAAETQRIDGAKVRSGLAAGEWNVRYHQEGVWTDAYQWRTFMRKAHAHIAAAGCDAAPKVILPAHCRPEYTQWLAGAGIENDLVVWM